MERLVDWVRTMHPDAVDSMADQPAVFLSCPPEAMSGFLDPRHRAARIGRRLRAVDRRDRRRDHLAARPPRRLTGLRATHRWQARHHEPSRRNHSPRPARGLFHRALPRRRLPPPPDRGADPSRRRRQRSQLLRPLLLQPARVVSDELFSSSAIGQYPNLGVQDAFVVIRRGTTPRGARVERARSTAWTPASGRSGSRCSRGCRRLRVIVEPNDWGLEVDLTSGRRHRGLPRAAPLHPPVTAACMFDTSRLRADRLVERVAAGRRRDVPHHARSLVGHARPLVGGAAGR